MTANPPVAQPANTNEDVIKGGLFALVAIPLGVILLVLLSSIGFIASIVGFVVAAAAVWLYRRGSGGFISRSGAFVVTGVVVVALLIGIWISIAIDFAGGLGHLGLLGQSEFWDQYWANFGKLVGEEGLFVPLVIVFGALGAFQTLRRAFAIARQPRTQEQIFGQQPPTPYTSAPGTTASTIQPTSYQNDVDGPPSASVDDKTPPPTPGA
jgi:hypothetical protein